MWGVPQPCLVRVPTGREREVVGAAMARPTVMPTSVRATVPEAFMVLHLRMRVVEEQTSALVRDLEVLGVDGQR